MRHARIARQSLRLASESSQRPYICRACLAQASRQFSSSSPKPAEDNVPFWKRMNETLFGSKEKKQADESREEKTKRRIEEAGKRATDEVETKTDRHGRVYEVAKVVDPSFNDKYIQSTTWDGLESVGSEQWVRERADQGEQYLGFTSRKQAHLTRMQWANLLHHVAVEALALQSAGRDLRQLCNPRQQDTSSPPWEKTTKAEIIVKDHQISVNFANEQEKSDVLQAIVDEEQDATGKGSQLELAGAMGVKLDSDHKKNWMQMPLQDPQLKFAIIKRITQLVGKRIPDIVTSDVHTLGDLHTALQKKETPKKLALTSEAKLASRLPNVVVHSSRRTPVHKEKEIGRWKIIEGELLLRDLPVFGSRHVDAKEGKMLQRPSER